MRWLVAREVREGEGVRESEREGGRGEGGKGGVAACVEIVGKRK